MLDRLTANLQFHGQALALRAERQQVLASNIANADTPDYQARDLDFAKALQQATGKAEGPGSVRMEPTRTAAPGHLRLRPAALALSSSGSTELSWRVPEQPSIDGNTVDLDRERANFADNSLRYEATLRFINGNVRNVLSAIRGD